MEYLTAMLSDQGEYRKSNQDSVLILGARSQYGHIALLCVCDGMGGYQSGEVASRYCLDGMSNWFKKRLPRLMRQHAEKWHDCVMEDWRILVHDLNRNLLDYAGRKGGSLGSTLTAILIGAGQYQIVHVGDSRAYEIGENAVQITQDQSLVAREVRMGRLTGEQARLDKRRNILLQCLGVTRDVRPLFYQGKAKEACLYLVCTDGFWHSFRDEELSQELCRFAGNAHDLQDKLSAMILKCRESGERDNISVACMIPTQDHTRLAAEEADEERTLEIYGEPDTNDSAEAKDENGEDPTQEIPSVQGPLFVVDMEKRLSIL